MRRRALRGALLPLIRWFDSWAGTSPVTGDEGRRPDVVRVIPLVLVHAGCLAVFVVGWSPAAVATAVALYAARMFAITGFYHRYFSHAAFKASRPVQFAMAIVGASAMQRGPLWWAAHHRRHHAHSDGPLDVHSPRQHGFWWSHVGWITSRINFSTDLSRVRDLARHRELCFLDRFDAIVPALLAGLLLAAGALLHRTAPSLGTNGPQMLVWGFFVSTVVLLHCTLAVNSLGHGPGRKRFDTGDDSRNSLPLALLTFGEGWHENHHRFPSSARMGLRWWEIDLTHAGLRLLEALGLIRDLVKVPERALAAASRGR